MRVSPVLEAALAGLSRKPKSLPPWLFYDEAGCALFDRITRLAEYYPTRTELALLRAEAAGIAALLPAGCALVEYGAGSEDKALILLDALAAAGRPAGCYQPIDVAETALRALASRLDARRPTLPVRPVVADFQTPLTLALEGPAVGFFPGSTIGNLDPPAAVRFLALARGTLGPAAYFLVGVDLPKDPAVLIAAYDDAAGVTAAFNRNLLARLNRDAGADFDLAAFDHRAIWNAAESRIEMHLVSRRAQMVRMAGRAIAIAEGESIHTENSYKHAPEALRALARRAGWRPLRLWTDTAAQFSLHLLTAA